MCAAPVFRWLANRLPDKSMRETRAARKRLIALVRSLILQRKAELDQEQRSPSAGEAQRCAWQLPRLVGHDSRTRLLAVQVMPALAAPAR